MKSKKVLTILLSMAIMLTFMPTFAFADATPAKNVDGHHEWTATPEEDGEYWVSAGQEDVKVKVIVEPTCDEPGVGEVTCTELLNGEACGAVKTVKIYPLGHKAGRKIRKTSEELMDYIVANQIGNADNWTYYTSTVNRKAWHENTEKDFCEGFVYECETCGAYLYKNDSGKYVELEDPEDANDQLDEHTVPAGTPDCQQYYDCAVCGGQHLENPSFVNIHDRTATDEDITVETVEKHALKSDGVEEPYAWVEVVKKTCNECGETWYEDPVAKGSIADAAATLADFDHSSTETKVIKEPTCEEQGMSAKVCKDCGYVLETSAIEKADHKYETVTETGKADDDDTRDYVGYIITLDRCTECNAVKPGSIKKIGYVDYPAGKYEFSELTKANCEQGSWILVKVTQPGSGKKYQLIYTDNEIEKAIEEQSAEVNPRIEKINGKYYYNEYPDDEFSLDAPTHTEIPYTPAIGHKFGAMTSIAEATCVGRALEGKVCENCKTPDHQTVREVGKALGHDTKTYTVEPTCGNMGYTYDSCSRCKQIVLPDGAKDVDEVWVDDIAGYADVYNVKDPVVALGTPCNFEWKVTKEPTATEEGTKALICTVCGTVKDGSETVIPNDKEKKEAEEQAIADAKKEADAAVSAAKTAEDAAAKVTAADYTADSVKAVADAKAELNKAKAAVASAKTADEYKKATEAVKAASAKLAAAAQNAKAKAASKLTVKAKKVKAKAKKKVTKVGVTVSGAAGTVTYAKANKAGKGKIKVNAKTGKITVKKGLKKKTYKVKVKVTDLGNANTKGATKTVTVKVKVK